MTKYSDFVKSYMAKHGKTWNCAVCEIKKSGAYEKHKKGGTEKKEVAPSRNVSIPIPLSVEQASQVKTIAPSPIPAAAALVEKPVIRKSAPLVMPEILGQMIQDFARPVIPQIGLKLAIMFGTALLKGQVVLSILKNPILTKERVKTIATKEQLKTIRDIIKSARKQLISPFTDKDVTKTIKDFFNDVEDKTTDLLYKYAEEHYLTIDNRTRRLKYNRPEAYLRYGNNPYNGKFLYSLIPKTFRSKMPEIRGEVTQTTNPKIFEM